MNEELFRLLDGLEEKYKKVWIDVCSIESPTNYKAGVDAVGEYFIRLAKEQGFQVEIFEQEISGNVVCITMNENVAAAPICLSGHMDTVFPLGSLQKPLVRLEGDKIYGPGVMDCKGGLVVAFMVMEALKIIGYQERPIRFLLQSDEENSSLFSKKATIDYICEKAKGSAAFINLEGAEPGEVCIQRKGVLNFTLTVKGEEAHASFCAIKGSNAILEAAYKIIELEKLKDDEGLTCNCGVIQGGSVANTVPKECVVKINIRFANEEQRLYAIDYVNRVAETNHVQGCSTIVELTNSRIAMAYSERNIQLLEKINKIFIANGFSTLKGSKRRGGSDAAEVTMSGIPTVDNLSVVGGDFHTADEFAYVDTLLERAKRIGAIICDFEKIN